MIELVIPVSSTCARNAQIAADITWKLAVSVVRGMVVGI